MTLIDKLNKKLIKALQNIDYHTVFLSGSKSIHLEHALSDTDVMLLSDSLQSKSVKCDEYELKIVAISDVEGAICEALKPKRLNLDSQILLSDIYHGKPIINAEAFEEMKKKIPWSVIIQNMVSDRLRGYKFYRLDGWKFYDTQDLNSARFCFQRALENLIDAYLFSNRLLIIKDKWRLKSLRELDCKLFDEFIIIYSTFWSTDCLLTFLNKYEKYCKNIFQFIQKEKNL